jgi:hypothetical protein
MVVRTTGSEAEINTALPPLARERQTVDLVASYSFNAVFVLARAHLGAIRLSRSISP